MQWLRKQILCIHVFKKILKEVERESLGLKFDACTYLLDFCNYMA